ncbi:hypothetical protein F0562_002270 [Nyssa sinensis]|uniref:Ninja-family protein n=1 Tax=Nyssa sinensis TaxID=561372 RepID=A0A5J5C6I0_9ASTE|nr:hypothetical protein F0562_002270 [Nyssa sinensis]
MLEVSSVVVEEEDDIELSLGLSIGGIFRKTTELNQIDKKINNSCEKINSESTNVDTDLSQDHQNVCATQTLHPDSGSEYVDPQKKREIHARRRQEGRKKREEKLKRGLCRGVNGGFIVSNEFSDDKIGLEAQRLQTRVRDREMKENEVIQAERACKQGKSEECVAEKERKDLNLTLNYNGALNQNQGSNPMAYSSSPSIPVQYPIQYVPYTNGFAYPYVMPCWAPTAGNFGNEKNEKNVFQPVARRSFRPYLGNQSSGQNMSTGCDSEHNSSKDGGNGNAASNGSPVCSSSAVSDYVSKSQQGGSSSDTGSHSCYSQPEQHQLNGLGAGNQQGLSEHSASSNRIESTQSLVKATNTTQNLVSSNITQSGATQPNEKPRSETQPGQVYKPIPTSESPTPSPLKGDSGDMGKPPNPQTQNHDKLTLQQMPCVSTTGNGPHGKTISGFLYRYTKTEVSIICVCHGSSFSPAEFVEHAGGEDILHPLRHITVTPPAFG